MSVFTPAISPFRLQSLRWKAVLFIPPNRSWLQGLVYDSIDFIKREFSRMVVEWAINLFIHLAPKRLLQKRLRAECPSDALVSHPKFQARVLSDPTLAPLFTQYLSLSSPAPTLENNILALYFELLPFLLRTRHRWNERFLRSTLEELEILIFTPNQYLLDLLLIPRAHDFVDTRFIQLAITRLLNRNTRSMYVPDELFQPHHLFLTPRPFLRASRHIWLDHMASVSPELLREYLAHFAPLSLKELARLMATLPQAHRAQLLPLLASRRQPTAYGFNNRPIHSDRAFFLTEK